MQIKIDWSQNREDFSHSMDVMVSQCKINHLAVTLPLKLDPRTDSFDRLHLVSSLVSQYSCQGCDAHCCKAWFGDYIALAPADNLRLQNLDGGKHIRKDGNLPYPCPYLVNNRCSIYDKRPTVCATYPVQPATGGLVGIDADCPQTAAIGKRIYMASWSIMHAMVDLK